VEFVTSTQGVRIPKLIYGTAWKEDKTADLVELAIETGFRGIDTACQPKHYQEDLVGQGIKRCIDKGFVKREDLFLQTKFTPLPGQDPQRIPYDPSAPLAKRVEQSLERSLLNLQTDYLDSWVLHSPMENFEDLLEVWSVFENAHSKGQVKQLGISNCYDPGLFRGLVEGCKFPPSVIQNRFYQRSDFDKEIRKTALENQIWYQSFWTLTANPHIVQSEVLGEIAQKYERSSVQVLFRLLTQIGMTPLTGTTNPKHMKEDLEIFEFELSSSEIEAVRNKFGF